MHPNSSQRFRIVAHVLVTAACMVAMALFRSYWVRIPCCLAGGVSLFVLTGLVHEASHWLLARPQWFNDLLGNLTGWPLLTPLSAYRAFHLQHHQTTNRDDDPNRPLNSRVMLLLGSAVYLLLIHVYACRHFRGTQLVRYLVETGIMVAGYVLLLGFAPGTIVDRAWFAPLVVVYVLQNLRIVSEHLDLPAGHYQDTWQLVLPAPLSGWLLHFDHHLEHHLRPRLHWHELPKLRREIEQSHPELLRPVTYGRFLREVFLHRPRLRPVLESDVAEDAPRRKRAA